MVVRFDHQQSKQGGSEDAGYYCRDRSGKERLPGSRLRCEWQAGVAQATLAAAAAEVHREPPALPGGDGGLRGRALLGARDWEARSPGAADRAKVRKALCQ